MVLSGILDNFAEGRAHDTITPDGTDAVLRRAKLPCCIGGSDRFLGVIRRALCSVVQGALARVCGLSEKW